PCEQEFGEVAANAAHSAGCTGHEDRVVVSMFRHVARSVCRSWLQQLPFENRTVAPSFPGGEIDGEQIRIDALNEPFEELVICEHALSSEWVLLEIGHRVLSAGRAVDEKPSLIAREGTRQGQFASALKCPVILPMCGTNGCESRFVG